MLTYKVKYRLPGQLLFKTIKNVVEDDVFAEGRMRFFTTVSDVLRNYTTPSLIWGKHPGENRK
jgi:hypothetical protein